MSITKSLLPSYFSKINKSFVGAIKSYCKLFMSSVGIAIDLEVELYRRAWKSLFKRWKILIVLTTPGSMRPFSSASAIMLYPILQKVEESKKDPIIQDISRASFCNIKWRSNSNNETQILQFTLEKHTKMYYMISLVFHLGFYGLLGDIWFNFVSKYFVYYILRIKKQMNLPVFFCTFPIHI